MDKVAKLIVNHRLWILTIGLLLTAFLAVFAVRVEFQTNYAEMLPTHDPFVETHLQYEGQYGGPQVVRIIVERLDGRSIYQPDTLQKIRSITRTLDTMPGVNPAQIYSLASRKVRHLEVDEQGAYSLPLLDPGKPVPSTPEELALLKSQVLSTPGVVGEYVSWDGSAAYIKANLIEGSFSYPELFSFLQSRVVSQGDEQHRIHIFGQPVLTGWVHKYDSQTVRLLAASVGIMLLALLVASRSLWIVVIAGAATLMSAVWGLGVVGLFGWSMDPLIVVIPMLIMARTLSHSVQMGLRHAELIYSGMAPRRAAEQVIVYQFRPGALGIVTDALGIFAIALADIPMMQKLAVFCGVWALSVLFSVLVMGPVMLSFFRENTRSAEMSTEAAPVSRLVLRLLTALVYRKASRRGLWLAVLVLTSGMGWLASHATVGALTPGTSLLWQDSDYNQAEGMYAQRFIGPSELQVIFEAPPVVSSGGVLEPGSGVAITDVRNPETMDRIWRFQDRISHSAVVRGSLSYVDLIPEVRRAMGGHPKFDIVPVDERDAVGLMTLLQSGSNTGDFDRFFDNGYEHAVIRVYLSDLRAATVDAAVRDITQALAKDESTTAGPGGKFRLAAGSVALAYATNHEVEHAEWMITLVTTLVLAVAITCAYRSFSCTVILLLPLLLGNIMAAAVMAGMGISFDVNTLPIVSVGMGVGIDYGIYLISRMRDEVATGSNLEDAVRTAVRTCGRAIFFTAVIMIIAVMIWYIWSGLRFQAEMGLLLALLMAVNCLGALILIPLQVLSYRPSFLMSNSRS